ncbi:hypothetical protein BGX29_010269 [Mortierella sp. GBA35]|nr:hypothetical protein BGX29_010269 [Mortierella sp. GBA35]
MPTAKELALKVYEFSCRIHGGQVGLDHARETRFPTRNVSLCQITSPTSIAGGISSTKSSTTREYLPLTTWSSFGTLSIREKERVSSSCTFTQIPTELGKPRSQVEDKIAGVD